MQTKTFEYKGRKLSYRMKGEGPLLVLLHGFGEDGNVWKPQFDIFPNHQLVIPDLPGSGQSEMIDDMSMEGMADAVRALIEDVAPSIPQGEVASPNHSREGLSAAQPSLATESNERAASSESKVRSEVSANPPLGGGGAVLIGHSMGGYVTLAFAEKYPTALNAFGLFHSTAFADSEEKKETRRKGIAFIEEHGAYEFLKTATSNLYAPVTKAEKGQLIDEHLKTVRNADGAALVTYYQSMIKRPDRTAVLKNSRVPVLFVMGRHDNAVPLSDGLKQCHLPQLSYIELLEHAGHMGMVEEAEQTNAILNMFMKSLETGTYT